MTVRVATILSAREWEANLVAHARDSAAVRIVLRAFQPQDIDKHLKEIDVVVAGGDVSWVTPAHVSAWRASGLAVIGVYPTGDRPAARLLEQGGASEVVPDTIDVSAMVQAIRFVAPGSDAEVGRGIGRVTAVVGARGAPGCTEVAIAYAMATAERRRALLMDLDIGAPSIAVRLGLPARPDLTDVAESIRETGEIDSDQVHSIGRLSVVTGSHRANEPGLKDSFIEGVVRAASTSWDEIVLDVGAAPSKCPFVVDADAVVLVIDGSALGVVRAAQLVSKWMGPAPAVVLNRVNAADRGSVVEAVRKWTGLEPAVIIPDRGQVRRASRAAKRPERKFANAVAELGSA